MILSPLVWKREQPATTCTHFKSDHFTGSRNSKGKCLSSTCLTIPLHLLCPQSLRNWGAGEAFLQWKLGGKLWQTHQTQQGSRVTKQLLIPWYSGTPWSKSNRAPLFSELTGPQKPKGGGNFEDNLEKQPIYIQRKWLFESYILMRIKSRVYKLFMVINDLTARK